MPYSLENITNIQFPFSLVKFSNSIMYTVISGFWNFFLLRKENFIVLALVSFLKLLKLFTDCLKLSAKLGFSEVPRRRLVMQHPLYKMRQVSEREKGQEVENKLSSGLSSLFFPGSNAFRIRKTYKAKCSK